MFFRHTATKIDHIRRVKRVGFSTFTVALALALALAWRFIAGHVKAPSPFLIHLRRRAASLVPRGASPMNRLCDTVVVFYLKPWVRTERCCHQSHMDRPGATISVCLAELLPLVRLLRAHNTGESMRQTSPPTVLECICKGKSEREDFNFPEEENWICIDKNTQTTCCCCTIQESVHDPTHPRSCCCVIRTTFCVIVAIWNSITNTRFIYEENFKFRNYS